MINHRAFVLSSQSNENNSDGFWIKCKANEHTTISTRGSFGTPPSSTGSSTAGWTTGNCVPDNISVDVSGSAPSPISLKERAEQG